MKSKKSIFKVIFLIILLITYISICYIQSIPDNIVIFEGEKINLNTIFGLTSIETSVNQEGNINRKNR